MLLENVYRWNHDERHYHKVHKFRCRFNRIEVKCIFKCDKFEKLWDHHPKQPVGNIIVVDGISKKRRHLTPFYNNLRETNIANGYLLCYHFRIISKENCANKLRNNIWYSKNNYTLDDLISSDYSEIQDETIKHKSLDISCLKPKI